MWDLPRSGSNPCLLHWRWVLYCWATSKALKGGLLTTRSPRKFPDLWGLDFPGGTVAKNLPANAAHTRVLGSSPQSGRSPGVGNGNPFHYSCLENSMDRGAWWGTVHGVTKSWTQLSMHTYRKWGSSSRERRTSRQKSTFSFFCEMKELHSQALISAS